MKNKLLKLCLVMITFFITVNLVKAGSYTYDYMSDGDNIIRCYYTKEYDVKEDDNLTVIFQYRNLNPQVDVYVNGKWKKNTETITTERVRNNLYDYFLQKGTCPAYAALKDDKYVFSNTTDGLGISSEIYEYSGKLYNSDYCYYNFNLKSGDFDGWGVYIKKDKLKELENPYNGEGCPNTVIAELHESTETDSAFSRKFYATNEIEGEEYESLKTQCAANANQQVEEMYNEENGYSCFIGKKQELIDDKPTSGKFIIDPTNQLNCDALFDEETKQFISFLYFVIEIIAVILVVVLTIKDYAVAILNSNQDEFKKSNKRLITRIILLIVLLLIPGLLRIMLKVFHIEAFNKDPLCGTVEKSTM